MNASKKLQLALGEIIESARSYAHLTQEELAARAKTHQSAIARAETRGCDPKFVEKCLGALGYDLKFHHVSFGNSNFRSTSFLG